jgi:hypothetical protein
LTVDFCLYIQKQRPIQDAVVANMKFWPGNKKSAACTWQTALCNTVNSARFGSGNGYCMVVL